ncbi:MAG: hypothetical protein JWM82_2572, partial [Myxococcales bacterium]|nr:hypothetical protein [Myxococcales bacterium]
MIEEADLDEDGGHARATQDIERGATLSDSTREARGQRRA